jgi:hypothetical protein
MIEEKQIFNSPDEILRAAVARARSVPEGFRMSTWIEDAETPCGTAGCLAYEICAVAGDLGHGDIAEQATELLGLEFRPAIFHLDHWPKAFRERHDDATTPEERVDALDAVVEAWITGTLFDDVTHIAQDVSLSGYKHQLPASLQSIGRYVYLRGYENQLPESLQSIGGSVDLSGYEHQLPASLQSIGRYVYLRGYEHQLPASLQSIGGSVDLRGYEHQLPASLQSIGGSVDLSGYEHQLPPNLTIKGQIIR